MPERLRGVLASATLADDQHPPHMRAHLDGENGWSQARAGKLA
jgi:hypothetical protein